MKLPKADDRTFELCPAGLHLALCFQVIDLGSQETIWQGEKKIQRKIRIGWELPEELMEDGRPFMISRKYTLSSFKGAKLMEHLNSWRGQPFTDEDYGNFEMKVLIGQPCQITVLHEAAKNDPEKIYANIMAIAQKPKSMTEIPKLINDPVYWSLDDPDQDAWDRLPDFLHQVICLSPEYKALQNQGSSQEEQPATATPLDEIPF